MIKELGRAVLATVLSFLTIIAGQAQKDSISTYNLKEVIVTANKYPKELGSIGKVVDIIDEDEIRASKGLDLSRLLDQQPGITVNGATSNPGKDKAVYIQGGGSAYALILIDGIPVSDPSGVGGAFDLRSISLDQVKRIEILKGSQSTLYGTDAVAGVINIITEPRKQQPMSGTAMASYGSYNSFRGQAGLEGSNEKVDYALNYDYSRSAGISEAALPSDTSTFDKDGFERHAAGVKAGVRPWKGFYIRPFFRYSHFEGGFDLGAFNDDPDADYRIEMYNYGVKADQQLRNGGITLQYAGTDTRRLFSSGFGEFNFDGVFHHAEVFGYYRVGDFLNLMAGAAYQVRNVKNTDTGEVETMKSTSPFLTLFLDNVEGFSAEVGVRTIYNTAFGDHLTFSFNPSYLIGNRIKLFASYTTGFKAPTLDQLYGQFGANPALAPEVSRNLGAGMQYISPNAAFDVSLNYFDRIIRDVIVFNTTYMNQDEQNDTGLELSVSWEPDENLRLQGSYQYLDGAVTNADTTYQNLFRRPVHAWDLSARYQFNPSLSGQVQLRYIGRRDDLYFDFANFATEVVEMEAYQLLDVSLYYDLKRIRSRLFLDVRNLLNQKYYEVYGFNTQGINFTAGISARFWR